jgi:P4 family phage/plasmid primase-like protien
MSEEFYEKVKSKVEDSLDWNESKKLSDGNCYINCLCGKHKAKEQKFSYNQNNGKYNCHSGSCGLPKNSGNAYILQKHFGIWIEKDNHHQPTKQGYDFKVYHATKPNETDFIYRNKDGSNFYLLRKWIPKDGSKKFTHWLWDTKASNWIWREEFEKQNGKPNPILYNLDKIQNAHTVILVEGEKCADAVNRILPTDGGYISTTLPGGAKATFQDSYVDDLKNKIIYVIPDFDDPGTEHKNKILNRMRDSLTVAEIFKSDLEKTGIELLPKEDIADWIKKGGQWKGVNGLETILKRHQRQFHKDKLFDENKILANRERIKAISEKTSEDGSRKRFISRFGENVIFVPQKGKNGSWFIWDGVVWKEDFTSQVTDKMREVSEIVWKEIQNSTDGTETFELIKHFQELKKQRTIKTLLDASADSPEIRKHVTELDKDPNIIACKNAYVDLDTLNEIEPDKSKLVTKQISMDYIQGADCPEFLAFLERSQTNSEIRILIQKIAGSFLTGEVNFNKVFFFYGEKGGNGKSVFIDLMFRILGEYAVKGGASLIDEKARTSMDDLAILHGARLVIPPEISKGAVLKGNQIKEITGGEEIKAEHKFQTSFNFRPQFTFLMYGNHKPLVDASDGGIRRRLVLIPWEQEFKPGQDGYLDRSTLNKRFEGELPGILNWMVQGLYLLKKDNWDFKEPENVLNATNEYFEDEDRLNDFLDDCLDSSELKEWEAIGKESKRNLPNIYKAYTIYTKENGSHPLSIKNFKTELKRKGLQLYKEGTENRERGIIQKSLKTEWETRLDKMAKMNEKSE